MVEDNKIQISEESLRELFSGSVPQEVSNFVAGLQKVSPADLTDILSANPELFSVLTNVPEKAQIAAAEKLGRKVLPLIRGTASLSVMEMFKSRLSIPRSLLDAIGNKPQPKAQKLMR